jgi:ubiquinone/menaquinone biosynthesis C-methylase UbiE
MSLTAEDYDKQWSVLSDYIKYNPGARHRRRLILKLIKRLPVTNCLDIGCGKGELLILLSRYFNSRIKLTGADLSSGVIKDNLDRIKDADFFTLDIEKENINRKYDLIICSEVLEHLTNRRLALMHILNMMDSKGYLLVTVPTGKIYDTERYFGHVSHPTQKELKELARENNLRIIIFWNWGFPFYKILKWITNINSEWAIRNFGSGNYSFVSKFICNSLYFLNFLNLKKRGCQLLVLMQRK